MASITRMTSPKGWRATIASAPCLSADSCFGSPVAIFSARMPMMMYTTPRATNPSRAARSTHGLRATDDAVATVVLAMSSLVSVVDVRAGRVGRREEHREPLCALLDGEGSGAVERLAVAGHPQRAVMGLDGQRRNE